MIELKQLVCVGISEHEHEDVYDVVFYSDDIEDEFKIPVVLKDVNKFEVGSYYQAQFVKYDKIIKVDI